MKKILSLILAVFLLFGVLCGCSGNSREWMNYDMTEYVTLGDYSSIEIDMHSEEFLSHLESIMQSDLSNNSLTATEELKEGTVENGDTVDIAFVGKIDGEEFSGGSADSYDLVIGSNSFIDGFEDGLIGAAIGETRDLDLTFPDPYENNPDLAGKPVVFTVTVNGITRTSYPELTDEIATNLGYDNAEDYKTYLTAITAQDFAWDYVVKNSEILKQPEKEIEDMVAEATDYYTAYASSYGYTFEEFITVNGLTVEEFETTMAENAKLGFINNYIIAYALVDANNLCTDEAYDEQVAILAEQSNVSVDEYLESSSAISVEREVYTNLAINFIESKVVYTEN